MTFSRAEVEVLRQAMLAHPAITAYRKLEMVARAHDEQARREAEAQAAESAPPAGEAK